MDWIPEVLKNLKSFRSVVVAVFLTSGSALFAFRWIPAVVPKPPEALAPFLFLAMAFTGFLLATWVLVALWEISCKIAKTGTDALKSQLPIDLSHDESALLLFMARTPSEATDLNNVKFEGRSALEVHQLAKSLRDKGMASSYFYNDVISMTDAGREHALKIQRQVRKTE